MPLLKRANHSYRKLFSPYHFLFSKIQQSKEITMNGQTYVLVGQQSIDKSPFITNFVVYDDTFELADQSTALEIYFLSMISIVIEELQPLHRVFQAERNSYENNNEIIDTYGIGVVSQDIYEVWDGLSKLHHSLNTKQQWTMEDFTNIRYCWTDFWQVYKERAFLLMMLPKRKFTKRDEKSALSTIDGCVLYEATLIRKLLEVNQLQLESDPLHLSEWIYFNGTQALANVREITIHTKADKQSKRILSWSFYIILLGIITPFFIYRTYEDGFWHLFILFLFYVIYFALYYTNKYRLKQSMYVRMMDIYQLEDLEENRPLFHARATSVNMGVSIFYITIATATMFGFYFFMYGWDGFALFYLILMIVTIIFNVWFIYSPFVEKDLTLYLYKIRAGHRVFPVEDLRRISVDKNDVVYTFYLTYTSEPYEVHVEKSDRKDLRKFMEQWCERNEVDFTLFNKHDRTQL